MKALLVSLFLAVAVHAQAVVPMVLLGDVHTDIRDLVTKCPGCEAKDVLVDGTVTFSGGPGDSISLAMHWDFPTGAGTIWRLHVPYVTGSLSDGYCYEETPGNCKPDSSCSYSLHFPTFWSGATNPPPPTLFRYRMPPDFVWTQSASGMGMLGFEPLCGVAATFLYSTDTVEVQIPDGNGGWINPISARDPDEVGASKTLRFECKPCADG